MVVSSRFRAQGLTGGASAFACRSPWRGRRGFTVVELVVVLAIIGVLFALILPAVQRLRETANFTECSNHLKQLGLACELHQEHWGYFPTAGWDWYTPPNYTGPGQPAVGEQQQAGWGFQILPFIEQTNLWQSDVITAIATTNPIFFCPTRRSPSQITYEDQYTPPITNPLGDVTHALCDYAANNLDGTGVFRQYYPIQIDQITDGLSNTLLLGEKRLDLQWLNNRAPDDNEGYTCGWDHDIERSVVNPPKPDPPVSDNATGDDIFGSSHPAKFNTVFADGSVQAISYSINAKVWMNLGNIADGQSIPADAF